MQTIALLFKSHLINCHIIKMLTVGHKIFSFIPKRECVIDTKFASAGSFSIYLRKSIVYRYKDL